MPPRRWRWNSVWRSGVRRGGIGEHRLANLGCGTDDGAAGGGARIGANKLPNPSSFVFVWSGRNSEVSDLSGNFRRENGDFQTHRKSQRVAIVCERVPRWVEV